VRMRAEDISYAKIASELGDGLKDSDIKNRWNCHLKDKLSVSGGCPNLSVN